MILELFAGPGGWDEGLRLIDAPVAIGIEWDKAACLTRHAAGHLTIRADVATYPTRPFVGKVDGIIASPPCPDFSSAGKRKGVKGKTGHLIYEVMRWTLDLRPTWLACEQVPEVLPYWRTFARRLVDEAGYHAWAGVLCAADYGVPQERYRAFLLAHAERPVFPPAPTHAESPAMDFGGDTLLPWVSMAEGLGWGATGGPCPTVTAGGTRTGGAEPIARGGRERLEREREVLGYRRTRGAGMTERHGERPDTPSERPAPTITSKARTDVLLRVKPTATMRERERAVSEPAPTLAFGHNAAGWGWVVNTRQRSLKGGQRTEDYRREAERPSPTLTAQAGGFWQWERPATTVCGDSRIPAPGHKDRAGGQRSLTPSIAAAAAAAGDQDGTEAIKLTVAEALTLQGFDPAYPVQGSRTKQFEQVGNAVPPPLAAAVLGMVL